MSLGGLPRRHERDVYQPRQQADLQDGRESGAQGAGLHQALIKPDSGQTVSLDGKNHRGANGEPREIIVVSKPPPPVVLAEVGIKQEHIHGHQGCQGRAKPLPQYPHAAMHDFPGLDRCTQQKFQGAGLFIVGEPARRLDRNPDAQEIMRQHWPKDEPVLGRPRFR